MSRSAPRGGRIAVIDALRLLAAVSVALYRFAGRESVGKAWGVSTARFAGRGLVGTPRGQHVSGDRAAGEVAAALPSLTGLRWIAAFLVFGRHLYVIKYFGPGLGQRVVQTMFWQADVGVSFFFILSGFVLMWSTARTPAPRFWRRRFARIYPLHAATAAIAAGFLMVHAPHDLPSPGAALANLTLVQAWARDPHYYLSLNTVSWTLSCEAFFYLVFPLIGVATARLQARGAAVLAATALTVTIAGPLAGALVASRATAVWMFHSVPLGRLPEFILGVALARLVKLTHTHLQHHTALLWTLATGVTVAGYTGCAFAPLALQPAACTAAGFALILIAASVSDLRGSRLVFQRRSFVKLGEISFAFYLVHLLVIRVLEVIVGYHPRLTNPAAIGLTILTFSLSLLSSWLLHETVEKPCRRWLLRSHRTPQRPEPTA